MKEKFDLAKTMSVVKEYYDINYRPMKWHEKLIKWLKWKAFKLTCK